MTRPLIQPTITGVQVRTGDSATFVRQIAGRQQAEPVVLIHGTLATSVFFEPLMLLLPQRFRPLAVDLRGCGGSDPEPVDATRGVRDFSDDVLAALDALGIERAHLVGWSLGGAVAMQAAIDAPGRVTSMTLIAPVSPYGFGGTVDPSGSLLAADGAGSGAGLVSRTLARAIADRDASGENRSGPRAFLKGYLLAGDAGDAGAEPLAELDDLCPGAVDEDGLVAAMLSTVIGPENFPGARAESDHWPGFAPGATGLMNAMAPTHLNLSALAAIDPKPDVLWLRGSADIAISDASAMDVTERGRAGRFDGYPGPEAAPPQPMLAQTRAVLGEYAAGGGVVREVVIEGAGHAPHLTALPRLMECLVPHLDGAARD